MDFATLKLGADTSALKQAEKALDDVAAAATGTASKVDAANNKIDVSFDDVAASAKQAAGSVSAFEQAVHNAGSRIPVANDNIVGMGGSSKLASHHVQNLAFQFQDLGVQLAGGANPLTAFIQQGSQISGIMMQAGMGVGEFVKQVALMTGRLAAAIALNPAFLAIAATATTAFVAFKDFQAEVGESRALEEYVASLNLTDKEMKKLEKSLADTGGVAISFGDVMSGLGKTIADMFSGLGPIFEQFSNAFLAVFRAIPGFAADMMSAVYGLVVGGVDGIVKVLGMMPETLGDLFYSGLNRLGNGIELFLNGFIQSTNTILRKLGMDTIDAVIDVPAIENKYAGAANAAGAAFAGSIRTRFNEARGTFTEVGDNLSRNIIDAAINRIGAAGSDIIDERNLKEKAKKAGKEAGLTLGEYITIETGQSITALEKSFKFDDQVMKDASANLIKVANDGAEAFRGSMQKNLETFSDVIGGIGDLFGSKISGSIGNLGDMLRKQFPDFAASLGGAFKDIGKSLNGVLGKLGTSLGQLGEQVGFGSAVGGMIGNKPGNQIGGAIGSVAGQAIGKSIAALGSFGGPIGMIAGSILGSVLGGLFKGKNPFADVRLSATGSGTIFNQRGGEESASAGQALGSAFSNELGIIAKALGATVNEATSFGAIGFSGDQFYFNPTGGDFKGAGAQRFSTAEQALTAAIRNAVDKGAFEGLSESSKAILASVTEINADAVVKAVERLNTARGKLVDAYNREAGAIAQTIDRFRGLTAGLQSFRQQLSEQLMSPEELFRSAQRQFAEVSALAAAGNERAISDMVSVSQRYLDAAQGFLTPEEYNREIENVMRAVDLAIAQSKSMEEYAQSQLDALNKSVEGLIQIDESVMTVKEAIDGLKAVMESFAPSISASGVNPLYTQADFYAGGGGGGSFSDGQEPPRFASGGMHSGGLAIVGERGPELVNMGPSRVWNADDTAAIMGGSAATNAAAHAELAKQNDYLRELVRLNAKQERTLREIELQGETP